MHNQPLKQLKDADSYEKDNDAGLTTYLADFITVEICCQYVEQSGSPLYIGFVCICEDF